MQSNNNPENFSDTKHLNIDLKKRSLRGGAITLSTQGINFLAQTGSTMILARLLTPKDFGVVAMVVAITGFANIFSEIGLSTATIQRANINKEQVSNLFWINVGLSFLITLIILAISPIISWLYKTPQLLWVTIALSLNFLITGLAIQHKALLTRQMQFYTISKVQICSTLIGIFVAIFMAMYDFHYWALVCNILTASACNTIGIWMTAKWFPCLPQRKTGIREMLRFGSDIALFDIINYFSRNLDNILIGRYCGTATLGLYSKAYQLLMLPISNIRIPLNKVALPSLSRLQNKPTQYRKYYIKFISLLAFLSMPFVMYLLVCSDELILLILGRQWIGASELFQILAATGLIQPVGSTRGIVLLSRGESRKYLWWGTANAIAIICAFVIGLSWGVKGVAAAYTIANYLILYPSLIYVFKGSPIQARDFFTAIYKPFTASMVMGASCFFLQKTMVEFSDITVLTFCFIVGVSFYLLSIIAIAGGVKDLREYYSYARITFSKK